MMANIKLKAPVDTYNFLTLYDWTASKARELALTKNKAYGDSFCQHGTIGCIIRTQDKLQRHINVEQNKIELSGKEEKVLDDLIDSINYLIYAYFLLRFDNILEVMPNGCENKETRKESEAQTDAQA
jgi:hypothetical protein